MQEGNALACNLWRQLQQGTDAIDTGCRYLTYHRYSRYHANTCELLGKLMSWPITFKGSSRGMGRQAIPLTPTVASTPSQYPHSCSMLRRTKMYQLLPSTTCSHLGFSMDSSDMCSTTHKKLNFLNKDS